jgi:hypothetical protein
MNQRFYIDGIEVNNPNNYALNEVELNFDKGDERAQVSIDTWELGVGDKSKVNDAEILALQHLQNGLTGGVGVGEGKPFQVYIDKSGTQLLLFDGFLDLWSAKYECGKITAKAIEQGKVDWLKSGVAEFSFEYLESIGAITEADYILVPYIISTIPNYREAFMATITIFIVTGQLVSEIQGILELTAEAANPFEASSIARLVLRIIYIATLLVALIKLLFDVYNLIVQPIKYHACMYRNDLLRIGAAHLGLTFSSSFLEVYPYNKVAILPQKFFTKDDNTGILKAVQGLFDKNKAGQKGFPSQGYTFADLLSEIQIEFNAKIICDGVTLRIEKQNYNQSVALYQIPAVERNEYSLNHTDFYSSIFIKYATDLNDRNTIQEYLGTSYQITTLPISVQNQRMLLTKNLQSVTINFALGKRKTELTFPEKLFDVFFKAIGAVVDVLVTVINAIIKVINGIIKILNKIIKTLDNLGININFEIPTVRELEPPEFSNLIEDRINMLKMETDFVSVPKLIMIENNSDARNNKLLPDNESVLSAKYLWDNFHYLKSFVPQSDNTKGNQYYIYPVEKVPFCFSDYQKVRENNMVIDTDGTQVGFIDTLKWNIEEQTADMTFRINKQYTANLREIKIEPNGI